MKNYHVFPIIKHALMPLGKIFIASNNKKRFIEEEEKEKLYCDNRSYKELCTGSLGIESLYMAPRKRNREAGCPTSS